MEWLDAVELSTPKRFPFTATSSREARGWQRRARNALAKCVGFLNQERIPLEPKNSGRRDRGTYIRYKVIIRTSLQSHMPMYVLIPKTAPRPLPCVLALHGHGYGVKDVVGLWEDGSERLDPRGSIVHHDFGCTLAEQGFLVIAPEASCFGERRLPEDLVGKPETNSCHRVATYALMLGGSAAGMRVWDAMRAVDYLETLKEADTSRLGAMGVSGGGMHTFLSTALDTRIKACVISGYFCDWRKSILSMPHCTCNFVPGLLNIGHLQDLAGLIAPRPCLVENGDHDHLFPLNEVQQTITSARRAWKVFDADNLLQTDFFEGRHEVGGNKAYRFLAEHLSTVPVS